VILKRFAEQTVLDIDLFSFVIDQQNNDKDKSNCNNLLHIIYVTTSENKVRFVK